MVDFRYRRPDARLAPFVKMYFWGRDTDPPPTQRTIPNGEMECASTDTALSYTMAWARYAVVSLGKTLSIRILYHKER